MLICVNFDCHYALGANIVGCGGKSFWPLPRTSHVISPPGVSLSKNVVQDQRRRSCRRIQIHTRISYCIYVLQLQLDCNFGQASWTAGSSATSGQEVISKAKQQWASIARQISTISVINLPMQTLVS